MRLPRSLHWRISLAYTALIFVTMGVVSIYLVNFIRDAFLADLNGRLQEEIGLVVVSSSDFFLAEIDVDGLQKEIDEMARIIDARVTIVDVDGLVLVDTAVQAEVDRNLRNREEIRQALATGAGADRRVDPSYGGDVMYQAIAIQVQGEIVGVARVGVPTSQLESNLSQIISTIGLSALIVAVLSVGLGYLLFRRTSRSVQLVAEGARRLAEGDLEQRVQATSTDDETRELADAFNGMASTIRSVVGDLSSERNKLTAVLDTMADGVVVLEAGSEVSLINRAAERLLDVRAEDAVGNRLVEVVRDHEIQQAVQQSLETGQIWQIEVELLPSRAFLSAIATPLGELDGSADAASVLLTLHDLTRMMQVETTRKEFVSNVSHELRNPLASIKAMVETIEDGAIDERSVAMDFLRRINRDVDRMNGIVNDLLELSHLESGYVPMHLVPVHLGPLVEEVVEDFQRSVADKNLVLVSEIPETLSTVTGETGRLRQVLVNLIENAIRYTSEGQITVSVSDEDQFQRVKVIDTGVGMPREHLAHVFERFYKVERSRRDDGTGLGLAIVKHIVQAHGGDVSVESEEGVGSTFEFTIPQR
jgi:two-component system phosphate regulon sensor histidine kinase PhoR